MRKIIFLTTILYGMLSCQSDVVYNQYQTLENASWEQEQVLVFEIPMQDTLSYYNIFINLRNTKDYEYSNLFLITRMDFPDKTRIIDTLEYEMTDAEGRFLGTGFSDLKENKLFYKEKVHFSTTGNYLIQIKQAMRKRNDIVAIDPLLGVSDVGVSVEKIE